MSTSASQDLEKGVTSNSEGPALSRLNPATDSTPQGGKDKHNLVTIEKTHADDPVTLQQFRVWAGIDVNKLPKNGLYARVVAKGRAAHATYVISSRLIIICIVIQIILGAALTALGATNASSTVVTVLGAVNTAVAGLLAFLKSSGLPNRAKIVQMKWNDLQDFIEQRERELRVFTAPIDVSEMKHIEYLYNKVKADIEATNPDGHAGATRTADTRASTKVPDFSQRAQTATKLA